MYLTDYLLMSLVVAVKDDFAPDLAWLLTV